jgi:hypothetical protein
MMIDLTSLLSTQNPMLKTKPLDLGGSASFSILYGSSLNVAVSAERRENTFKPCLSNRY